MHRNGDCFLLPDQHDQSFASGNAGVEKIPLQHGVMLGEHWDYHRGIFGSLALVNGHRVGRHQHVQFAEPISDAPPIEADNDLARLGVNLIDVADITVVHLLFIVVLDLHHLVAGGKGPAEPLDLAIAGRIERCLQLDVQRPRTRPAPVHRTQHLDVADRIEGEPLGDPSLYQFDDTADGGYGIIHLHEVEVALGSRRAEIRHRTLVDAMGTGDDPTLCSLPEYFGEPHYRDGA